MQSGQKLGIHELGPPRPIDHHKYNVVIMVDEMCKKYNQLKNVESRWENDAMMEWDKFTIAFRMYVTCLSFFWEG